MVPVVKSNRAFFHVRVFNPYAPLNRTLPTDTCYHRHEREKRCKYEKQIQEVEQACLLCTASHVMHRWTWSICYQQFQESCSNASGEASFLSQHCEDMLNQSHAGVLLSSGRLRPWGWYCVRCMVVAGSVVTSMMSTNLQAWGGSGCLYLSVCVAECYWAGANLLR